MIVMFRKSSFIDKKVSTAVVCYNYNKISLCVVTEKLSLLFPNRCFTKLLLLVGLFSTTGSNFLDILDF